VKSYKQGKVVNFPSIRDIPAMGLISTVNDLTKFIRMIFADGNIGGRQIIRPETIYAMMKRQNVGISLDLDTSVGFGWELGERLDLRISNASTVANMSGERDFHSGILVILPEHKLGVVVLANSLESNRLVRKAAMETLKLALEDKTGRTQPEFIPLPAGSATVETLRSFEGLYCIGGGGTLRISKELGHLRTELFDNTNIILSPRANGRFTFKYNMLGFIPLGTDEIDKDGIGMTRFDGIDMLTANVSGHTFPAGVRMTRSSIPDAWLRRLGRYEIINPGEDLVVVNKIRLREDRGFLMVDIRPLFGDVTKSYPIKPLSDAECIICGVGNNFGETLTGFTQDGWEYIRLSGYLFRKKY
jgi:hypothetical protein